MNPNIEMIGTVQYKKVLAGQGKNFGIFEPKKSKVRSATGVGSYRA